MHYPVVVNGEMILQPTENDWLRLIEGAEDMVRSLHRMWSEVS